MLTPACQPLRRQEIERSGRVYFWLSLPTVAVGLAFVYVGVLRVLAAIEDRSTLGGETRSRSA